VPKGVNSQLFPAGVGGSTRHGAITVAQIHEHLVQDQKRGPCGQDDEENPSNENCRTIATRLRALRALGLQLDIQHADEFFWRCLGGFDFFHGSMFGATTHERANLGPFAAF